jgi:hypothetical protein
MRRNELLAYVVGAAVAGSVLVFPYMVRPLVAFVVPGFAVVQVPFFLLPVVWGLWNHLYVRVAPPLDIGVWGSVLGLLLATAMNAFLYTQGTWFTAALALLVLLPVVYLLLWRFIVGSLNTALGV